MSQFEPGDLVQLKSGGPVMTVEEIYTSGTWGTTDSPVYRCTWFRGATRNSDRFEEVALIEADEDGESG